MRLLILVMMILATPLLAQPVKKRSKAARPDTVNRTKALTIDTSQIRSTTITNWSVERSSTIGQGNDVEGIIVPPKSYPSFEPVRVEIVPTRAPFNYIFQIDPLDDTSYRYWFGRRGGGEGGRDYTQELLERGFYHAEDIKGYDSTMIRVEEQRLVPLRAGSTPIIIQTGWYSTHRTDTLMLNVARSNQGWIITQAPIPTK